MRGSIEPVFDVGKGRPSATCKLPSPQVAGIQYLRLRTQGVRRSSIGEKGRPPCKRCHIEGQACVLAGSRRGGDFSKFRKTKRSTTASVSFGEDGTRRDSTNLGQRPEDLRGDLGSPVEAAFEGIQNPLEALRLLAEAAAENRDEVISSENSNSGAKNASSTETSHENAIPCTEHASRTARRSGLQLYEPVASGVLRPNVIGTLLER